MCQSIFNVNLNSKKNHSSSISGLDSTISGKSIAPSHMLQTSLT